MVDFAADEIRSVLPAPVEALASIEPRQGLKWLRHPGPTRATESPVL
jgi:hypothetical protein